VKKKIRVLFVCLGNICRSPMAEAVFQHMVDEAGLADQVEVDSAGTGDWHVGQQAHRGTLNVLKQKSIAYNGRARQILKTDLDQFDYVLGMDESNVTNILALLGELPDGDGLVFRFNDTEIAPFLYYANQAGAVDEDEVPDPYYSGRFDYTYDLVHRGSAALLDHIREQHEL
jgi:protein-tyrosine phosphatase